ncbi:(2Fe-2S)-binding protein [Aestuariispira insulae]|uniref:Aerobic-type carbon monoxide dehydrogenase small subunit (CoxS/CutS family) n=1 Tax=Aestuariispira insulae TaxID=1461337 RepID=A0A3D9HN46_9PROT|nr:2Fe-2S iron-sulfur cluster-binding protein [Aestuariispira insulae]RED50825.1 aerobic-type carbon monoxide dehydrogenase small subunit (CoxS/CutS family) [Aestuariispira insulae]
MSKDIRFSVNGKPVTAPGDEPDLPLVDFLQEDLGQTGTKFCCGIGVCRACTVAVRRHPQAPLEPMLSCSTPVSELEGVDILTVEGQSVDGHPNALQEALLTNFAFQCGYCTPGFVMAATVMMDRLRRSPVKMEDLDPFIDNWLGDHICRCTGYVRYYRAIKQVILNSPGLVA